MLFRKCIALLVVLFSLKQKQFSLNACADQLGYCIDYILDRKYISYGITHERAFPCGRTQPVRRMHSIIHKRETLRSRLQSKTVFICRVISHSHFDQATVAFRVVSLPPLWCNERYCDCILNYPQLGSRNVICFQTTMMCFPWFK